MNQTVLPKIEHPSSFTEKSECIFSGCTMRSGRREAPLFIMDCEGKKRELLPAGDYEHIRSLSYEGRIYCVFTEYQNRSKRINLLIIDKGSPAIINVTAFGKYDHPSITVHSQRILVAFEDGSAENSTISIAEYPIHHPEASVCGRITTPKNAHTNRSLYPMAKRCI